MAPQKSGGTESESEQTQSARQAPRPVVPAQTDAGSARDSLPAVDGAAAVQGATAAEAPAEGAAESGESALSDRDREVLEFEKKYWKYAGSKEQAIRERFGLSASRYYQVLNALLDRPEALELEPALVKRLRRMRAVRQRSRGAAPGQT
jgi:hypothetical protein